MEISIVAVNANGALITGAAASTALKIRRVSDGYLLDWDDLTFKASGWGHNSTAFLEVDASNLPGEYKKVVVITAWTDGFYQAMVHFDDATTVLNFSGEKYVQGGREVEINIDAAVSTRTKPADTQAAVTNVIQIGAVAQTGRDLGASVLLSPGTGVGQLDITSGVVKSNLVQILATTLTETVGGYLAAAFKKFLDVVTPVFTAASVNQSGDSYNIVKSGGVGDASAIKTQTDKLAFTVTNQIDANVLDWKSATAPAMTGDAYAKLPTSPAATSDIPSAATIAAAVWNYLTASMTTVNSIGKKLADWVIGTIDTYTGNTKQTGDVGVAGAGLTALGDTRLANLDAAVSTRTKPADTQAAVTTVATLTNAPPDSAGITTLLTRLAAALTITGGKVDVNDKSGFTISGTTQTLDALATLLRGADNDTLKTLSDQIDLQALEATLTAIKGVGWTNQTLVAILAAFAGITVDNAAIANAVWDETLADHLSSGSTGAALNTAKNASAIAGAGAITWVYTLTDSENNEPIGDADVWVTTDLAGENVIASGKTDQYGRVTLYLDAGIIYVFRQKSGWDFVNPDQEVVS